MKAADSTNHQTSVSNYDQSMIVTMGVKGYSFQIVTPDQKVEKKLSNKSLSRMAVLENTSETKLHPNIKVAQISAESISGNLGINPNNNIEVVQVLQATFYPYLTHPDTIRLGGGSYLADFIKNHAPNTKVLDFQYFYLLGIDIIKILPQLEVVNLSGLNLSDFFSDRVTEYISPNKLFLAWRMIKGNCAGITTDGSKLTDFQKFLKESDARLEYYDELRVKKILEKIEADYKSLFEFMEETFQIGTFRNAIEKLDRNLTLIKADPNSFEFKKLPVALNKQLVKAISILPAKDISFLISISSLSNTNIPISWFLSNTKIENTEITNLNNEPGKLAELIQNILLANVFDGNVKKPKSAEQNKQLELFAKIRQQGPIYESLQKYLKPSDWLSCTEYLKKTLQKALKQQTQLEEVKQEFAGDNNTEYDPLEV